MARIRTIKPEFWSHEGLARCSRDARLLFIGLFNVVDDEGRARAAPVYIHGAVFPYDEDLKITPLLDELERGGFIQRYESEEERFLFIRGFREHQKIDHPSASRLPEPPRELLAKPSRKTRDALALEGKGKERKGEEGKESLATEVATPEAPKAAPLVLTPPTPKPKRPAPPEQATACRQAWSERWDQEYRQLTGEAYAWSAADRQAVVTVCNLVEQDQEKAVHLLEEFLRRCASDAFYAKNRTPRFIASRVNELRLPLSTNGSNGAHPQALHSANVVFTPEQEQAHLEGGRKI